MKITILFTLFFCLVFGQVKAQSSNSEMIAYNISFGSIVGGVGALINKKPNERWDKVLLKGMGQGALGGYLIYEIKSMVRRISKQEKWSYSWYAKVINAAGTSMVENAASNRYFGEQWHFNIGFNRFELYTKDKFRVKYKIMPVSFLLTASIGLTNKFELGRSLQTGEFIFSTPKTSGTNRGRAYGNALLIRDRFRNEYDLYAHEIIHIYQYYDFHFVNTYFNKPYARWGEKSESFSKFNDIFYLDLNGFVIWPAYFLQERNGGDNNFFEIEADFYEH